MDNTITEKFCRIANLILKTFQNTENSENSVIEGDQELKLLFKRNYLEDLCDEAEKMKFLDEMKTVPAETLINLFNFFRQNIINATKVSFNTAPDNENISENWEGKCRDQVMIAADSALSYLYIVCSPKMPKQLYSNNIIGHIMLFIKFQITENIFSHYDGATVCFFKKDEHKSKAMVIALYNKIHKLIILSCEFVNKMKFQNINIERTISMITSTIFAKNIGEIQLSCLDLAAVIFMRYENYRMFMFENIFASRPQLSGDLPRICRLNNNEHIQVFTVLILQLLQSIYVVSDKEILSQMDNGTIIFNKSKTAMNLTRIFVRNFLTKVESENEGIYYESLFKSFIEDLVVMVNKPKWPATELLLSILGPVLAKKIGSKDTNRCRIMFLECLGTISVRLRQDICFFSRKTQIINETIKDIQLKQMEINDELEIDTSTEQKRIQFLQQSLLKYLITNECEDNTYIYPRHFYVAQWYLDGNMQKTDFVSAKNNKQPKILEKQHCATVWKKYSDHFRRVLNEEGSLTPSGRKIDMSEQCKTFSKECVDCNTAELISQYLAYKRSFSQNFNEYLRTILFALNSANYVANKLTTIQCLSKLAKVDSNLLGKPEVQFKINLCFADTSPDVQEAAIGLLEESDICKPALINKYFNVLSARIVNAATNIRKRVILILRDICIKCPNYCKISDIYFLLSKRLNDEEDIRKLIVEIFETVWFTPEPNKIALLQKVVRITNVVLNTKTIGFAWFEQLIFSLFKQKTDNDSSMEIEWPPESFLTACSQIVDGLTHNIAQMEKIEIMFEEEIQKKFSSRVVACLKILTLFGKLRPQFLVKHAKHLQHYLTLAVHVKPDCEILNMIVRTFKLILPIMEDPSQTVLLHLQEDLIALLHRQDNETILNCLSCFAYVINNFTHNYRLIKERFLTYFKHLMKLEGCLKKGDVRSKRFVTAKKELYKRYIFIVALLFRHFNFEDKEIYFEQPNIKKDVLRILLYFVQQNDIDIKCSAIKAIRILCIRHYEFFLENKLKSFYCKILTQNNFPVKLKTEILYNIEFYMKEEEKYKRSKAANLKEIVDFSSGKAIKIIPQYINKILESYINPNVLVRQAAFNVVKLVLQLGLANKEKILPYLICMLTDTRKMISKGAQKLLVEAERKTPGIIQKNMISGISISYQLQSIRQRNEIVRGFEIVEENEYPIALNHYLYSFVRGSIENRKYFVLSLLKLFEENNQTNLSYLLYLADNLAYFPYISQDEPLFVVHKIDCMVYKRSGELIEYMQEALQDPGDVTSLQNEMSDPETLVARLPTNTTHFLSYIFKTQKILILVELREYLKDVYGLRDEIISISNIYSLTANKNVFANRKEVTYFNPEATLKILKKEADSDITKPNLRKDLITRYLKFKNLIRKVYPKSPLKKSEYHLNLYCDETVEDTD